MNRPVVSSSRVTPGETHITDMTDTTGDSRVSRVSRVSRGRQGSVDTTALAQEIEQVGRRLGFGMAYTWSLFNAGRYAEVRQRLAEYRSVAP